MPENGVLGEMAAISLFVSWVSLSCRADRTSLCCSLVEKLTEVNSCIARFISAHTGLESNHMSL